MAVKNFKNLEFQSLNWKFYITKLKFWDKVGDQKYVIFIGESENNIKILKIGKKFSRPPPP